MKIRPRINDICTDLEDPPDIEGRREMRESFKKKCREGYPELEPLFVNAPVAEVFQAALGVAQKTPGWTDLTVDEETRQIQGVAITPVVRFRDDFVIRVRGTSSSKGKTRVDMRSKSRLGRHDFGANFARITQFLQELDRALKPEPDERD